jgi:hypothetical protein
MRWIGDINQPAAMRIQSFSSLLEIQVQPSHKSKKLKRFVSAALLKSLAWPGLWRADKMLEYGAGYLRMNVAR